MFVAPLVSTCFWQKLHFRISTNCGVILILSNLLSIQKCICLRLWVWWNYGSWCWLCVFDRGDYGDAITVQTLKDFHRERVKILVDAGADLIAFETIPNKLDAQVITNYLCKFVQVSHWFWAWQLIFPTIKYIGLCWTFGGRRNRNSCMVFFFLQGWKQSG